MQRCRCTFTRSALQNFTVAAAAAAAIAAVWFDFSAHTSLRDLDRAAAASSAVAAGCAFVFVLLLFFSLPIRTWNHAQHTHSLTQRPAAGKLHFNLMQWRRSRKMCARLWRSEHTTNKQKNQIIHKRLYSISFKAVYCSVFFSFVRSLARSCSSAFYQHIACVCVRTNNVLLTLDAYMLQLGITDDDDNDDGNNVAVVVAMPFIVTYEKCCIC